MCAKEKLRVRARMHARARARVYLKIAGCVPWKSSVCSLPENYYVHDVLNEYV